MDDERWTKLFWEAAKRGAKRGVRDSWRRSKYFCLAIVIVPGLYALLVGGDLLYRCIFPK